MIPESLPNLEANNVNIIITLFKKIQETPDVTSLRLAATNMIEKLHDDLLAKDLDREQVKAIDSILDCCLDFFNIVDEQHNIKAEKMIAIRLQLDKINDDVIRLPGTDANYTARGYDLNGDGNNDSTAIIYTEDPNLELGASVAPIPIGDISAGRSFEISRDDSLVALVEDASVRDLTNDNFYDFG